MASTRGRQVVVTLTNKSGGSVAAGDVVIVDTSNNESFTTTTSSRATLSIGVAQETIANNASGRVLLAGYAALINVPASVTRGHYIETHTVAKQATGSSTRRSGSFGQFITGGTTPTALLWGSPDSAAGVFDADVNMPWHLWIIPMITTPDATPQGTWGSTGGSTDNGAQFPFYVPGSTANSGGANHVNNVTGVAQNDAISYDVVLAAGTWDVHVWVRKSTNTGIITLQMDGVDQGTADTYAAAAAAAKVSVTGITVASTGKKRFNLKMATKNGSSSNYILAMFAIEFRRTA